MFRVLLKMALTNLWRRRGRSVMLIGLISLSLAAMLFMVSLYEGMIQQQIDAAVRSESGHLIIQHREFRDYKQLQQSIQNASVLAQKLQRDKAIAALSVRLESEGLISTARHSQGVAIIGIDAERERHFGQLDRFVFKGAYRVKNSEAIIGAKLAEKLHATIGSRVIISTQSADGEITAAAFNISGILRSNNAAIDRQTLFIDRAKAEALLGVDDQASQIALMLHDLDKIDAVQARTGALIDPPLQIQSWRTYHAFMGQMLDMVDTVNAITYAIVFLVVALGIFDVVLLSVLERVREFGIMMAVGTPFWMVATLVILESLLIGLMGFLLGSFLGLLLLLYFGLYGLDFGTAMESFGFARQVFTPIEAGYFTTALAAVLIATLLATLIPVRVLARLRPVEAIRFS